MSHVFKVVYARICGGMRGYVTVYIHGCVVVMHGLLSGRKVVCSYVCTVVWWYTCMVV